MAAVIISSNNSLISKKQSSKLGSIKVGLAYGVASLNMDDKWTQLSVS